MVKVTTTTTQKLYQILSQTPMTDNGATPYVDTNPLPNSEVAKNPHDVIETTAKTPLSFDSSAFNPKPTEAPVVNLTPTPSFATACHEYIANNRHHLFINDRSCILPHVYKTVYPFLAQGNTAGIQQNVTGERSELEMRDILFEVAEKLHGQGPPFIAFGNFLVDDQKHKLLQNILGTSYGDTASAVLGNNINSKPCGLECDYLILHRNTGLMVLEVKSKTLGKAVQQANRVADFVCCLYAMVYGVELKVDVRSVFCCQTKKKVSRLPGDSVFLPVNRAEKVGKLCEMLTTSRGGDNSGSDHFDNLLALLLGVYVMRERVYPYRRSPVLTCSIDPTDQTAEREDFEQEITGCEDSQAVYKLPNNEVCLSLQTKLRALSLRQQRWMTISEPYWDQNGLTKACTTHKTYEKMKKRIEKTSKAIKQGGVIMANECADIAKVNNNDNIKVMFLSPQQLDNLTDNIRRKCIIGPSGCGKTVVLMVKIAQLLSDKTDNTPVTIFARSYQLYNYVMLVESCRCPNRDVTFVATSFHLNKKEEKDEVLPALERGHVFMDDAETLWFEPLMTNRQKIGENEENGKKMEENGLVELPYYQWVTWDPLQTHGEILQAHNAGSDRFFDKVQRSFTVKYLTQSLRYTAELRSLIYHQCESMLKQRNLTELSHIYTEAKADPHRIRGPMPQLCMFSTAQEECLARIFEGFILPYKSSGCLDQVAVVLGYEDISTFDVIERCVEKVLQKLNITRTNSPLGAPSKLCVFTEFFLESFSYLTLASVEFPALIVVHSDYTNTYFLRSRCTTHLMELVYYRGGMDELKGD